MLHRLREPFTGEALFDLLPDIVYFVKNATGQYVVVNETLVQRCGLTRKSQLVGQTPSQVLRTPLGSRYEAQDRKVLETGLPLLRQLELHIYPSRDVGWCLTHKLPLLDSRGEPVGLVGISQDLRAPDSATDGFQNVLAAVTYAEKNLDRPPRLDDMAEVAGLSRYQLDSRMQQVYGLTTGQWLLKQRLAAAEQLLAESATPIASIAQQCGYTDQSAFSRQFRRATGLTPREYRVARRQR